MPTSRPCSPRKAKGSGFQPQTSLLPSLRLQHPAERVIRPLFTPPLLPAISQGSPNKASLVYSAGIYQPLPSGKLRPEAESDSASDSVSLPMQGHDEAGAKCSPKVPDTFSGLLEPLPLLHLPLSQNNQAGRKRWAWALQSHPRGRKGSSGTGACSALKPGRKGFTFPPGRHILFLWHPVPLSWLGARAHSFSWWPQATFPLLEGLRTISLSQNVGFAAAHAGT